MAICRLASAGVGMMIAKAQVPVLPVRIFGAFEALPRDQKLPRPSRITVSVRQALAVSIEDFPDAGKDLVFSRSATK